MTKAILYARVSTKVQVEGYSLDQQIEKLRQYAAEQGMEVLKEVKDGGYSGAKLDRKGLDEVRDLVAAGGVDVVLAQERDRLSREPAHLYLLREELAKHGCKLRALNDHGDGESPEGTLTDGILDQIGKFERAKFADRSRRNKHAKARRGEVVGSPHPAYGFEFVTVPDAHGVERATGYKVDEARMAVVKRIFKQAAEGQPIRSIVASLDGVPTTKGRPWSRAMIRKMIYNDLYKPHTLNELRAAGVNEGVLAGLKGDTFGVHWFASIPVPTPDAGLDRHLVEQARLRLGENRQTSQVAGRAWELSGGTMRCSECGRRMGVTAAHRPSGKVDFYMRCQAAHTERTCTNKKSYNAAYYEPEVWRIIRDATGDEELLRAAKDKYLERERAKLRPPENTVELGERLEQIATEREGVLRQNARGLIEDSECDGKVAALDDERDEIGELLAREEYDVEYLEAKQAMVEAFYQENAGRIADDLTPEQRVEHYRRVELKAVAYPCGTLELTWLGGQHVATLEPRIFPVPADSDPEEESSAGDEVQARYLLRGGDGVALDH